MRSYKFTIAVVLTLLTGLPAWASAVTLRHVLSVYADDKEVGLNQPLGIACSDEARFAVADTGNKRVLLFKFDGSALSLLQNIKSGELPDPVKVAFDPQGGLVVLDGKARRLARVNDEGKFLRYIEPKGMPDGRTVIPKSFSLDSQGNIFILDIFGARVLVLDPDGKFLRQVSFPSDYGFFSDLLVTPKGSILAVDSVESALYVAAPDDKIFKVLNSNLEKSQVRFPIAIGFDERNFIYLLDKHSGSVAVLGPDGSLLEHKLSEGWTEGALWYPAGICVNDYGRAFISDTDNNRVQVFELVR